MSGPLILRETDGLYPRDEPTAMAEVVKPDASLSPFTRDVLGAFDDERQRRALFVFRVAKILWEICQLEHADLPGFEDDPQSAVEAVVLLDHYDRNRQWSPFPVGTAAAHNRQLQYRLTEVASTLLGNAPGVSNSFALVPRPRAGWKSGREAPRHTDVEVETATHTGYAAWRAFSGASHWHSLDTKDQEKWKERATKVLTLAKIHQIDPRFAGPIVADVCFGGPTRRL